MKTVLKLIFLGDILLFVWGFYTKTASQKKGDLIIGSAVLIMAFIVMPLFIYVRAKGQKLSQYLFPKDLPKRNKASKKD